MTATTTPETPSSSRSVADESKHHGASDTAHSSEYAPEAHEHGAATVASLLSRLQAASTPQTLQEPPRVANSNASGHEVPYADASQLPPVSAHPAPRSLDLRSFTFQQALPYIAQLSQDDHFVEALRNVSAYIGMSTTGGR